MPKIVQLSLLVFAVAVALGLLSAQLENRPRARRALGAVLLVVYACVCVRLTVVGRQTSTGPQANLQLLWSYRAALMREGGRIRVQNASLLEQIVLNYLLFVPLGCLLPLTWPRRYAGVGVARGLLRVLLAAATCSLCIELAQLVLRVGLFELDDILDNALGAALGYLMFRSAEWVARQARTNAGPISYQPRHLRRQHEENRN